MSCSQKVIMLLKMSSKIQELVSKDVRKFFPAWILSDLFSLESQAILVFKNAQDAASISPVLLSASSR
jgi:hypothetical protein